MRPRKPNGGLWRGLSGAREPFPYIRLPETTISGPPHQSGCSGKYQDGWFFGHAAVEIRGTDISFRIEELKPPHGEGRVTKLQDWGMLGLNKIPLARARGSVRSAEKPRAQRAAGGSWSVAMPAR